MDGGEFSASDSELFTNNLSQNNKKKKRRSTKTKKRFSDDQIRSLEVMFESKSKLEPRKKLQLASELGLQPRQVAIWFQNKRARWKSKQLEGDYNILMSNYNTLTSQFEYLKKENHSLILQLKKLNDVMDKSREEAGKQVEAIASNSEDDSSIKAELDYFGVDEEATATATATATAGLNNCGSFTSNENWGNLESEGLLDDSPSYQWWDFWS